MDELKQSMSENKLTSALCFDKIQEISSFMRSLNLGKEEIRSLRNHLSEIRAELESRQEREELAKDAQTQEKNRLLKEKIDQFHSEIQALFLKIDTLSCETLLHEKDQLMQEIQKASLSKSDKMALEKALKPLKDLIVDKKQRSLSKDEPQAVQELKELLQERLERRKEISLQLEHLRKASGGSGLDFEKAFAYQEMIKSEKELLDKVDENILEIRKKMRALGC